MGKQTTNLPRSLPIWQHQAVNFLSADIQIVKTSLRANNHNHLPFFQPYSMSICFHPWGSYKTHTTMSLFSASEPHIIWKSEGFKKCQPRDCSEHTSANSCRLFEIVNFGQNCHCGLIQNCYIFRRRRNKRRAQPHIQSCCRGPCPACYTCRVTKIQNHNAHTEKV